jgi:hypothetical protein
MQTKEMIKTLILCCCKNQHISPTDEISAVLTSGNSKMY